MERLDKEWVLRKLSFLGINLAPRLLQLYRKQELIPAPTFDKKGQGAKGIYPPDTVAEAYAAYNLLRDDRLSYETVRTARQIGQHLETTDYHNSQDILNDKKIRILVFERPKETFYAFEWLWLKYTMLPEKQLAVNDDIRNFLLQWAASGDDEIEAELSGEYAIDETLPSDIKAIMKQRQREQRGKLTSLKVNQEARRIFREQGEAAVHEYLRNLEKDKRNRMSRSNRA